MNWVGRGGVQHPLPAGSGTLQSSAWAPIPALPLGSYVALDKSLHLLCLSFFIRKIGTTIALAP